MNKESIKVSIIIPTYGGRKTLQRAVDSVLSQYYGNIEVIVVDDNDPGTIARTDTERNMEKYSQNDKVKYIKQPKNGERSLARNTGITYSTGKYVMFLDDDDEFKPGKVEAQLKFMEECGDEYSCCYTSYINIDEYGHLSMRCAEKRSGYLLEEVLKRNMFVHAGSNLMVRKSVIEDVGGFDISISSCEDVEFLARLIKNHKLGYVDIEGLVVHTDKGISKNYKENVIKYIRVIQPILKEMPYDSQKRIIKRIQLQICRYDIGSKDYKSLLRRMKDYNISLLELGSYILHLLERKRKKMSCGYNK